MNINVTGPKIYWSFDIPFLGKVNITQTTISLVAVTLILTAIALICSRNLKKRPGKLQVVTEKLVGMLYGLVTDTMGSHNIGFAPYIGTLFLSSVLGSVIGMTQVFRSTTADLSVTLAWAIITILLVWINNIKNFGFVEWLKGFAKPILMTPMNIIGEIATPVSLAFRHFGNIAGGGVLTTILYAALASLTNIVFTWLPDAVLSVFPPIFQVGIPAVLSIYFDLFSGFVQALVFSLLSMVYIAAACPPPEEIPPKKSKKNRSSKATNN